MLVEGKMLSKLKNRISNINKGAKSAISYTIAILLSKGLSIITVPIFTRIMSTSQIGTVNIFNSWYSLLSAVATLSLTSGGYIVAIKEFKDHRDEYQSSVLTLTSIIAVLIAVLFCISPTFWCKLAGLPIELMVLMLFGLLVAPARDFWLARQRFEYKYRLSSIVITGSAIIASAFSVVAVIYFNQNNPALVADGRLFANYFVLYGVAGTIWILTLVKGKTGYNRKYWKFSLELSVPLIAYSIASQILNVSDRMMISWLVNNSAVGIYSTIYTVSSLSLLVWHSMHASFVPYLFQNIDDKDRHIGVKKTAFSIMLLYAVIAILLVFLAPEIVRILAPKEYYEAIYIMPPIAVGVFFTSLSNIYSDIAVYYKKTRFVMYPAIVAALLNVILNYIFIKLYGYMAAAYTTMVSYICMAILQGYWARKLSKQNGIEHGTVYDDKKLFALAGITVIVSMSGIFFYKYTVLRYLAVFVMIIVGSILIYKKYRKKD